MKATALEIDGTFKPIELALTFESPEEMGAVFAMFSHTRLIDSTVGELAAGAIRAAIVKANKDKLPDYHFTHQNICQLVD